MWIPALNKYYVLLIILVILIVIYYFKYGRKKNKMESMNTSKNKKSGGKTKNNGKSKKIKKVKHTISSDNDQTQSDADIQESVEEDDDEENIRSDAEELFNLAHDSLCNGITSEEFTELTGDLASTSLFIELKQLYNSCKQRGLDPSNTINIDDYVKLMQEVD